MQKPASTFADAGSNPRVFESIWPGWMEAVRDGFVMIAECPCAQLSFLATRRAAFF